MAIVERRAVELANALEPAAGARQELGVLTSLAIGVTVVAALSIGRDVLVPIALAILLSFMLVWLSTIDDPQTGSDRLRTSINADYYADSLRETVNICLTRTRADRPARPAAPEILIVKET